MRLLLLLLLVACGRPLTVKYGEVNRTDLIAIKGQPLEEKNIPIKDGKILVFSNNEKYQLDGDIVKSGFKDPSGDEKKVIYWQHRLKDCATISKTLPNKDLHLPPEVELACEEMGISVIYTQNSEFVSRVVEYAKK
jgi:hypothetical protein